MTALVKDIMGGGFSSAGAQAINGQVAPTVSAAGTTITDATQLNSTHAVITTAAADTGVKLYNGVIGDTHFVYNDGANPVKVYPPTSTQTINQLSAGTSMTLATNTGVMLKKMTSTVWIGFLSA